MTKPSGKRIGLAAGVAGLMAAGAATSLPPDAGAAPPETLKQGEEDCPSAASATALRTIVSAQTDYDAAPRPKTTKKAARKKAARKRAAKRVVKKAATKKAVRKKAAKKAAKRAARRDPC